ncbi:MAG TPA: aldehyde dehydrogenase family protein [Nevskiaceae bacterium]|nr:aldehyde dehydrogenase family protein [Nevskiaceae bacterium]
MLQHTFGLMIPGAPGGGATVAVQAPYDGQPIGSVQSASAADAEQALATAHALFRNRRGWLPLRTRIEILERTAALLRERAEPLALEAAREGGKPLVDSRVEVARAADSLKACVDALRTEAGEVIPMGLTASSAQRYAFTQHEPIGVVLAISAFNHPLNLIAHQVGPALAAGCPVLVKPARSTPLSCLRFVALLREAGLPEAWCQPLLPESHALTARLVADPRVGFLSFIGSAEVGWGLRRQLAPGTRCAFEHGGVAPVIVAEDADLDLAVPLLAKGGFYHAGQVCVSVQRIFVARSRAGELVERLAAAARAQRVGDPTLAETEVGPLITPAEVSRVAEWVQEATRAGARLAAGGLPIGERCFAPTVLVDPPEQTRISQAEVFGPVVAVYPVEGVEAACQRANALRFAFQAAVFTRSLDTALAAYQGLDASAVMVNDHTAFRVDWMPFAGLGESGLGTGGIVHTLREMQVRKMMVLRSPEIRL